jgi:small subunit ribosomal protein S1
MKQIAKAAEADAEAQGETNYSSGSTEAPAQSGGTLASDEQLAALREKLSGGQ